MLTVGGLRAEIELLLGCVRPGDREGSRIDELLERGVQWTRVVGTALSHGVSPLVAWRLTEAHADRLPGPIRDALAEHLRANRERTRELVRGLVELLAALAERGVVAIPFKGPVLGCVAYGDPSLRLAGDLDLLVREEQVGIAGEVLSGRGFRELTELETGRAMTAAEDAAYRRYQCEYAFFREHDRLLVEPHWAIAPRTMAVRLDYPTLWSRAGPVPLPGHDVLSLSLEDLLLVLCIHGSKHEWTELRWIGDVSALLDRHPEIDLALALDRARSQGAQRMLLIGLGLAHGVLGTALPAPALAALRADGRAGRLAELVAHRLFDGRHEIRPPSRVSRFRVRMRERPRDQVAYVVSTALTPSVDFMRAVGLPASLPLLHVPIKLAHDGILLPAWLAAKRGHQAVRALMAARRASRVGGRVLVVDGLPPTHEGGGFPRKNAMLRLLAGAGYPVTLHPVAPCFERPARIYADLPREVEVVRERGIEDIEEFLASRWREVGVIVVSRPATLARMAEALARHPECDSHARLIYAAEEVFARREILRRRALGEAIDAAAAERLVAAEVALAARADTVLVGSRAEQEIFWRHGAKNVTVLAVPVRPAPTARRFAERAGLLFVGCVADDGGPDADALVWFQEAVLPELRPRFAALGEEVQLTVAGPTGAGALAARPDPSIRFVGMVRDLAPVYDHARVVIAPARFATSVPVQIYEAAARGVPVVATRLLADQLGWRPDEDLLAGEVSDAVAFADNVVALYTEPERWARVRKRGLGRVRAELSSGLAHRVLAQVLEAPRI